MANYTKIENDLLDYLFSANFSGAELQILLYLIRITKGFHRSTAKAAYKYIANGTGLSIPTVKRTVLSFIKAGIVTEEYPPNGSAERMLRIEWSNLIRNRINSDTKSYQVRDHIRINSDHQEIKEEIKDKKEKKRKASPNLFPNMDINSYTMDEALEWQKVLSEEDWRLFLEGKVWE